jgi:hypothetical protein
VVKKLRQLFHPACEGNDNKPHILRPRAIAFVVMVALVAESAFVFGAKYIHSAIKVFWHHRGRMRWWMRRIRIA